eukprot:5712298-Pyramimonas_sp.AAC.1
MRPTGRTKHRARGEKLPNAVVLIKRCSWAALESLSNALETADGALPGDEEGGRIQITSGWQ